MRFLYCPECGNLRPRGWFFFTKRCEVCGNEMVKFNVPMTKITPFYYASLTITFVVLALYLLNYEIPYETGTLILLIALTMVLAFADYTKSHYIAKEMMRKKKEEAKKLQQES
ncbi:MAG: hypothetical protein OEV21_02875 [Thermoplasmata archaeon]|nr:hypothetical protein [Thermoplasmata archaeon]